MKKKLIIVGTGQWSKDLKAFVDRYELFDVVGYAVEKEYFQSVEIGGAPVYPLEELERHIDRSSVYVFETVSGFHYLNRARERIYGYLLKGGYKIPNIISPKATVLSEKLGLGNWIRDYAYLDYGSSIGSNNFIDNYVYIGHYTRLGSHIFMTAKSLVAGNSSIGDRTFVGVGANVFSNVNVGYKCIIGAGTNIKGDIAPCSGVKVSSELCEIKQYSEDMVEEKLKPVSLHRSPV